MATIGLIPVPLRKTSRLERFWKLNREQTLGLLVIANAANHGVTECFANAFDRHAIKDLLEEAGHDHANRFFASEPAAHGVEDQFVIDSASRRTMGATHVVRFDFQTGNRIRAGSVG